jgi:hypothetical protein
VRTVKDADKGADKNFDACVCLNIQFLIGNRLELLEPFKDERAT